MTTVSQTQEHPMVESCIFWARLALGEMRKGKVFQAGWAVGVALERSTQCPPNKRSKAYQLVKRVVQIGVEKYNITMNSNGIS